MMERWGKLACGRKTTETIQYVDSKTFDKTMMNDPASICSQCYWSGWTR